MDHSLKNKTRQKRAAISEEYEIHSDMKLTMSIKDLLSASSTKKKLTFMLGKGLLKYFFKRQLYFAICFIWYIHQGTWFWVGTYTWRGWYPHSSSCICCKRHHARNICFFIWHWSIVSLAQFSFLWSYCISYLPQIDHWKGTKKWEIDVFERVQAIGYWKCQALLGFHNFFWCWLGRKICWNHQKHGPMPT